MAKRAKPALNHESVWDYPRPPRAEDSFRHLQVVVNGVVVADTRQGVRVLETGHAPAYFFPPEDVLMAALEPTDYRTTSEYQGEAHYFRIRVGERCVENVAWCYPDPQPPYDRIKRYLAFFPALVDACLVDDEPASPEANDLFAGWITHEITGLSAEQPE